MNRKQVWRIAEPKLLGLFLFVCAVLIAPPAVAATYTPAQAAAHVGEVATVAGPVSQTRVEDDTGEGFILMGGRYPKHVFHGFIPKEARGRFGDLRRYEGKFVAISGKIEVYNGRPEIVLSSPTQIKVQ
jgi:hypothetical protein